MSAIGVLNRDGAAAFQTSNLPDFWVCGVSSHAARDSVATKDQCGSRVRIPGGAPVSSPMTSRFHAVTTCVIAAAVLAGTATPLAGQARVPLRHPTGFTVLLPPGWRHTALDDARLRLLPPDAIDDEAVLLIGVPAEGVTSVTDRAFLERSEADVRRSYPALRRVGAPTPITTAVGDGLRLDFEGQGERGRARMTIYMVVKNDLAMTLIALGTASQVATRASSLDGVFATVRLDPGSPSNTSDARGVTDGSPTALEWSARIGGQKLTVLSGYGSTGSSGGMTSRSDLVLLRNGRFTYTSSSAVSISVDGMSGGSSGQDAASGSWRIASRNGRVVLSLTGSTGRRQEMVLTRSGTQTFLNGTRAFVTPP